MNASPHPSEDARLSELLQEWRTDAPLPRGFQQEVWRRVAAVPPGPMDLWRAWLRAWFLRTFTRPATSFAYIAILVLIGLGTGFFDARQHLREHDNAMAARYLRVIIPNFNLPGGL